MSQTTLNVRMDEDVKKGLEKFCYAVGLNVSVAVNLFAKTVVREQRLPFEIALNIPNEETQKAIEDVANRKGLSGPFYSLEDLLEELNADD